MSARPRIVELDGLRTLAIVSVMLYHFSPSLLTSLGWAGVDLFFVLSGFLITGILLDLRSDPTPYRKFYWRRVIRIFPPYYAVLAIIALLAFAQGDIGHKLQWLTALTFLPAAGKGIVLHQIFGRLTGQIGFNTAHSMINLVPFSGPYNEGLDPYWSLAVEELFYLLWAPVILKCSRRTIMVFAIAPLFVCPFVRGLSHTVDSPEYFGFITRFDTLAVGGCLALLLRAKPNLSRWAVLAPIPPLLVSFGWLCVHCGMFGGVEIKSTELFSIFGYSLLALFFGCVVGACVRWEHHPVLAPLRLGPIIYVGIISYTMYLIHSEAYLVVSSAFRGDLLRAVVTMALTLGVAALSWEYFETPILRLRNWPEGRM